MRSSHSIGTNRNYIFLLRSIELYLDAYLFPEKLEKRSVWKELRQYVPGSEYYTPPPAPDPGACAYGDLERNNISKE